MKTAPIALFTFNRLDHTTKTVEALRVNNLADVSDLIVFSDGARNELESVKVQEVRKYLKTITGFKSVSYVFRENNLGLAKSIISGVSEIVEKFGKIIVMEDDLVTSPHFLEFMNDGLSRFQFDPAVGSIHGYVYPIKAEISAPFFLKGADCWGWATWKRGWDLFEKDGQKLMDALMRSGRKNEFDFEGTYRFSEMLQQQIEGKVNSWAIRWQASMFLADKLCLYPHRSLVQNIGFDGTGVHCQGEGHDQYWTPMYSQRILIDDVKVHPSPAGYIAFREFFQSIQIPLAKRILWGIRRRAKKLIRLA